MKILVFGGRPEWLAQLSARSDIELAIMDSSQEREARRAYAIDARWFPFSTKAKVDFQAIRQIRRVVRQWQPDIVQTFCGKPLANTLLATTGMRQPPQILSSRGVTTEMSRFDPGYRISYLHPRVAGHLCNSDAVRAAMVASGIPPSKCRTVYTFLDATQWERPGRSALLPLGIPENAFVVATVANMRPVKGLDILLRAALRCTDLDNVYWLLIGRKSDPNVLALARDRQLEGRVIMPGILANAKQVVSGADLFVMPSRAEGMCKAVVEAMLQGVCPIVSDAGGMKEAVRNEVDGLVVPREDPVALEAAIRRLYQDSETRHTFAKSGQRRAADVFTLERYCQQIFDFYDERYAARRRAKPSQDSSGRRHAA